MTIRTVDTPYLPPGLPIPIAESDGLSAPFWNGLHEGRLMVQRCQHCKTWQFGPEWLCHQCLQFDPGWQEVEARGRIYSWERVWHASHDALNGSPPYLAVLVELPDAGNVRIVGNLLGDPLQDVVIGAEVVGVFEHHPRANPPFSLLQWQLASSK